MRSPNLTGKGTSLKASVAGQARAHHRIVAMVVTLTCNVRQAPRRPGFACRVRAPCTTVNAPRVCKGSGAEIAGAGGEEYRHGVKQTVRTRECGHVRVRPGRCPGCRRNQQLSNKAEIATRKINFFQGRARKQLGVRPAVALRPFQGGP
jgi:hypothetical protein